MPSYTYSDPEPTIHIPWSSIDKIIGTYYARNKIVDGLFRWIDNDLSQWIKDRGTEDDALVQWCRDKGFIIHDKYCRWVDTSGWTVVVSRENRNHDV